jgi:predicted membrane channel-forming protein YqfA (hemolysin III family)
MRTTRNIYAISLASLVLAITIFGLLGIWDLIEWQDFMKYFWKIVYSLIVLFISGAVILFIFSTLYKAPVKPPAAPDSPES